MSEKTTIKAFLVLVFLAAIGIAATACNQSTPVDLEPMQTQIAQLETDLGNLEDIANQNASDNATTRAYAESLAGTINDLIADVERHDGLLGPITEIVGNMETIINQWIPHPVSYVIYGSDGRPMNDGAIQAVRSHIAGSNWILEFHIADFYKVNVADYFIIVPTSPTPSGWVGSGVGTCFADPADRPYQVSGAALWKNSGPNGEWGIICAWDDIDGVAANLWGKTNANHLFNWVNRTGSEFIITVPWY